MLRFVQNSKKRKGGDVDEDESSSDDNSSNAGGSGESDEYGSSDSEEGGESDESGSSEDNLGVIPVDVLRKPILSDPSNPTDTFCLLCPGKKLKNPKMVEVHSVSNSHLRRLKRFAECVGDLEEKTGHTPSVSAVFSHMDSTTTDLAPKERPANKQLSNEDDNENRTQTKSKPSRQERKLARKARREHHLTGGISQSKPGPNSDLKSKPSDESKSADTRSNKKRKVRSGMKAAVTKAAKNKVGTKEEAST